MAHDIVLAHNRRKAPLDETAQYLYDSFTNEFTLSELPLRLAELPDELVPIRKTVKRRRRTNALPYRRKPRKSPVKIVNVEDGIKVWDDRLFALFGDMCREEAEQARAMVSTTTTLYIHMHLIHNRNQVCASVMLLVDETKTAVGLVTLSPREQDHVGPDWPPMTEVSFFYVARAFRRQGVGRRGMDAVLRYVSCHPDLDRDLFLWSFPDAKVFWQEMGFVPRTNHKDKTFLFLARHM